MGEDRWTLKIHTCNDDGSVNPEDTRHDFTIRLDDRKMFFEGVDVSIAEAETLVGILNRLTWVGHLQSEPVLPDE